MENNSLSDSDINQIVSAVKTENQEKAHETDNISGLSLSQAELDALFGGGTKKTEPSVQQKKFERPKNITVIVGHAKWTDEDIAQFNSGAPMDLDTAEGTPVEILADGHVIGRGKIVKKEGHNAVELVH